MRIAIDARLYGLENAGIGRYTMNLIDQIEKLDKENEYLILLRKKYFDSLRFTNKNFHKVLADIPHYSSKEQFLFPLQLIKLKADLVHFPHFNAPILYKGKYVVTIHDLIKHTSRGIQTTTRAKWLYWFKYVGYKIVVHQAVDRAIRIFVPSQAVKDDLLNNYSLPSEKVIITYEGVDEKFRSNKDEVKRAKEILDKYQIKKPFVIYTGSVYPHKNIKRLIQAIKLINDPWVNLVVSCARSNFWKKLNNDVEKLKMEDRVKLVGFVPDDELVMLYHEAEVFVLPTLTEGFGLPGIEAMSSGLPVICSDIPALREIYGSGAIYFDPFNTEEIAERIIEVCKFDKIKRTSQIEKGLIRVKKYSWKKMTKETLKVYKEALNV
ncbi:MAG: glycosyltransferase family 1 protein [bacterium]|nr:glycosyltransferase family 1 protein [bacterium]